MQSESSNCIFEKEAAATAFCFSYDMHRAVASAYQIR